MSSRTIKTIYPTSRENIKLSISTSHDSGRKIYRTSVWREEHKDNFISVNIMGDSYRELTQSVPCARFSQKKLEETHTQALETITENLGDLLAWASEKATE